MSDVAPISHAGVLTAAAEYPHAPHLGAIDITRFAPSVQVPPSGGTLVVQIQDVTGGSPTNSIQVTIADGDSSGATAGSVPIAAGAEPIVRIVSNSGGAQWLEGFYDYAGPEASSAPDLVTLADVKAWLKITTADHDSLLALLISGVSDAMARWMGATIVRTAFATELYDGDSFGTLVLRHRPLLTDLVTPTVLLGGDAIAAGDLHFYANGTIKRALGATWVRGLQNVAVTYEAGYAAVPQALRLGTIEQVAEEWHQTVEGGDRLGQNQKVIGDATISFEVRQWTSRTLSAMRSFRQPRV